MSRVLEYLMGCQESMTSTLEQLVMLESPSNEVAAVNSVARYLEEAFQAAGAFVEALPQDDYGDHLRISWGEGEHQALVLGHMDTVWPLGEVQRRPFTTGIGPEGVLIGQGPGCFDMKGGLVIGLFALIALKELNLRPAHRLVFLLNSDEEVGSPSSRAFIEAEARRSDAVFVLEPSRKDALVTWRKGVGRFGLTVRGQASHSGAAHEQGASAVLELAHQVLRLEAMTDYERGTTLNVGTVQGGSKVNVRPATASASIDLRVLTAEEGQRLTDAIYGLQPVSERTSLTVSGGMNRPAWEPAPGSDDLFQLAQTAAAKLDMNLWPAGTGGGSDGNFTAALGVPTLDGLGVVGNHAHALTEWVDLRSLPRRAALLAELLVVLGS
jgi:glutamate carboxypeptidase